MFCWSLPSLFQPIKRKSVGEEKKITQEEMLLEAAQTGASHGTLNSIVFLSCCKVGLINFICFSMQPCGRDYELEKPGKGVSKRRRS